MSDERIAHMYAADECWNCQGSLRRPDADPYDLRLVFAGGARLGGFGHRRDVGCRVCSNACLVALLRVVADQAAESYKDSAS